MYPAALGGSNQYRGVRGSKLTALYCLENEGDVDTLRIRHGMKLAFGRSELCADLWGASIKPIETQAFRRGQGRNECVLSDRG